MIKCPDSFLVMLNSIQYVKFDNFIQILVKKEIIKKLKLNTYLTRKYAGLKKNTLTK